jgi:hypothetical protein
MTRDDWIRRFECRAMARSPELDRTGVIRAGQQWADLAWRAGSKKPAEWTGPEVAADEHLQRQGMVEEIDLFVMTPFSTEAGPWGVANGLGQVKAATFATAADAQAWIAQQ